MSQEPVTVVLFKDNLTSRTLRIPLSWFHHFGLIAGSALAIAAISTIAAVGFYWKSHQLSPARVQDLERQIETLENKLTLAEKAADQKSNPGVNGVTPPANSNVDSVTTDPANGLQAASVNLPNGVFFGMLPPFASDPMPPPANLHFKLSPMQLKWEGRNLRVRFNIQYVADDGGNQQGRIFVIARGPSALFAYPSGVFDSQAERTWLEPSKGEFFSVSRFREVDARLGPVDKGAVTEVYGVLLNTLGKVIAVQTGDLHSVPGGPTASSSDPAPATPAPKPKAAVRAVEKAAEKTTEPATPAAAAAPAPAASSGATP